jgi:hypothetical protein
MPVSWKRYMLLEETGGDTSIRKAMNNLNKEIYADCSADELIRKAVPGAATTAKVVPPIFASIRSGFDQFPCLQDVWPTLSVWLTTTTLQDTPELITS